jgi:signal transduction histidine kinase
VEKTVPRTAAELIANLPWGAHCHFLQEPKRSAGYFAALFQGGVVQQRILHLDHVKIARCQGRGKRNVREHSDNVVTDLKEALQSTNELIGRVRNMSLKLRPAMLDDLGLLAAFRWHFDRYMNQVKIKVDFKHTGLEGRRFAPEIETAVYRIVQETLTNVARHARVNRVEVSVETDESRVFIRVKDLGFGFGRSAQPAGFPVCARERSCWVDG